MHTGIEWANAYSLEHSAKASHGLGVCTLPEGSWYEGEWRDEFLVMD